MGSEFGALFKQQVEQRLIAILKADEPNITEAEIQRIVSQDIVGYNDAEIEILRLAQNVAYLPDIYRQFLRTAGHGTGGVLFSGGDKSYRQLQGTKRSLLKVMAECDNSPVLSADTFIFLSYQGVNFFFFIAEPSHDDPPVYYYSECDTEFMKVSDHLSTWFLTEVWSPLRYPYSQKPLPDSDIPF